MVDPDASDADQFRIESGRVGTSGSGRPFHPQAFGQIRVLETWAAYADRLTWGRGQCLALLDDGCDLDAPAWQVQLPWGPKVAATWNSVDGNDDPTPVPPGYHGTTVGNPSSVNLDGVHGIAYNDFVAQVRCVGVVHLTGQEEASSIAAGLRWVLEHHRRLKITAVNLSPLDDQAHAEPVETGIDATLTALRLAGVWVSAPCGNHDFSTGVSWPACQPDCFGIGATVLGRHEVYLDRGPGTDLLVSAAATSSSNAFAAACSMILREAIEKAGFDWTRSGRTLPDAMMAVFQQTGVPITDPVTDRAYRELDLLAAVDHVFNGAVETDLSSGIAPFVRN